MYRMSRSLRSVGAWQEVVPLNIISFFLSLFFLFLYLFLFLLFSVFSIWLGFIFCCRYSMIEIPAYSWKHTDWFIFTSGEWMGKCHWRKRGRGSMKMFVLWLLWQPLRSQNEKYRTNLYAVIWELLLIIRCSHLMPWNYYKYCASVWIH